MGAIYLLGRFLSGAIVRWTPELLLIRQLDFRFDLGGFSKDEIWLVPPFAHRRLGRFESLGRPTEGLCADDATILSYHDLQCYGKMLEPN